ncbi:MAG: response regulator [Proteobacteria bacterium]|nr:response regulator [Pseudomonadota bacterium]
MTETAKTPEKKLAALRLSYASNLGDNLAELTAMADLIAAEGAKVGVIKALSDLRAKAHRLAGSAGTFGFPDLGEHARNLELFCQAIVERNSRPSTRECGEISNLVKLILASNDQRQTAEYPIVASGPQTGKPENTGLAIKQTVLLVEDDIDQIRHLELGLGAFGYQVKVVDDPAKICAALEAYQPAAVLLDLEFSEGRTAGADAIQKLRSHSGWGLDCPLIVLTAHSDFDARLAAVRAGCDQFLEKPVKLLACLSGCYPHLLNVGWVHSPE